MPRLLVCAFALLLALPLALLSATSSASTADGRPCTDPLKSPKGAGPRPEYRDGDHHLITTTFSGVLGIREPPALADRATANGAGLRPWTCPNDNCPQWRPLSTT